MNIKLKETQCCCANTEHQSRWRHEAVSLIAFCVRISQMIYCSIHLPGKWKERKPQKEICFAQRLNFYWIAINCALSFDRIWIGIIHSIRRRFWPMERLFFLRFNLIFSTVYWPLGNTRNAHKSSPFISFLLSFGKRIHLASKCTHVWPHRLLQE